MRFSWLRLEFDGVKWLTGPSTGLEERDITYREEATQSTKRKRERERERERERKET